MATKIDSLQDLVQLAICKSGGNDAYCDLDLIKPTVAARIRQLTDIDVSQYKHSIGESAIRHALNRHGDNPKERSRHQTPLTAADFLTIPLVVSEPDDIVFDTDPDVIIFRKTVNGQLVVVSEMRRGRKKLALVTMWKKPLSAPVAPHLNASTAQTSETFGKQAT
jgi:phage-Barnase-EndoU-ColicinE5/D-RelE like nuclease3